MTGTLGRALLLENIHPSAVEVLRGAGFEVEQRPGSLAPDDLADALQGVTLLGIRSNTTVTAEVIAKAGDLAAIGCFCIGTNQVDLAAATDTAVPVFNAPYSNSRSVVELVIGEIIALSRRLTVKNQAMHNGVWDKSAGGSYEVRGRTLGIVGYGNIGTQLANVAEALGMRVVFFDIADRPIHGNARRMSSLDQLLETADVVSLHVDGRPGNAGMFGDQQLAKMKPGAIFINASRGMVVDDSALRDHLLAGHLGGAALDVFPVEPKAQGDSFESVLRGLENVILTPHIAASTKEAQEEIGWFVAGKLLNYVRSGDTSLSVNFPRVQLPAQTSAQRLSYLHHNVPGVLAELNSVVSAVGLNIEAQALSTTGQLGYVLTDFDSRPSEELIQRIAALPHTITARLIGEVGNEAGARSRSGRS
ncbi:phosphoglycerate dehydrogenase [Blastococcus sp. HT6-30]|uniref:phosphoglycerate dehydrogenase n=1 Tax=Blastococcus sp. HT6-30 TaxID=3144843 RepID=UPI003219508F